MPSASDLLQNRVNRAIWWHFKKWLQCLLPRDLIPCICAICSVLLGCEMQPSQRHWAIAMHCPHPSPRSQLFNWVSLHFNYLPCHSNSSTQRWMLKAYHLMSWLRSLKEKQINNPINKSPRDLHTQNSTYQLSSHLWKMARWKHSRAQFKVMRRSSELCLRWATIWPSCILSYLQQRINISCLTLLSWLIWKSTDVTCLPM